MIQRNSRRTATTLALAGLLSLLPLAELQAAPRRATPARQDLAVWQAVQQQASTLWGGLGRLWNKVGARIDDNGFFLRLANDPPQDGVASQGEKPANPGQ